MRTQSCGKGTAHLDVMVTVSDSGGDLSSCSQMVRSHRWYQAHRPEAQRRRREAYAKEVKTKYPRAKITTRPRHPRGR